ncbi:hypothetical protein GX586_07945 [bacterium]|nr:hypothetical protein [bacterium]
MKTSRISSRAAHIATALMIPVAIVAASSAVAWLPGPRALSFAVLIGLFLVLLATRAVQDLLH